MNRIKLGSILLFTFLMVCTAFGSAQHVKSLDQRIKNVENGLVNYTFDENFRMSQLVDSKRIESLPKFNLMEGMQNFNIPGVSIAVIDDFKIAWTKTYGVMEAGTNKEVTEESLFQSGSTTKLLMAILILKMVEDEQLDLDVDINNYLDTWKVPDHPSGKKVSLRLLLTHRSGLNRPGNGFDKEPGSSPTLLQFLKGEKPVLNDAVSFDYPPETEHSYSNFSYLVMQHMLEEHFHTPYAQLVDEYIFEPLKLKSSFIAYPFPEEFEDRVIRPHDREGRPSLDDGLETSALAQAGMITTPSDWAKVVCELMLAYQGKSERILSQASVQAMFSTEEKLDPAKFEGISDQGLGLFLFNNGKQKYFLHHGHNSPGANCFLIGSTTTGHGAVIMTNGMRGIPLAGRIVSAISREYGWDASGEL